MVRSPTQRQLYFPHNTVVTDIACGAGHCLALGGHKSVTGSGAAKESAEWVPETELRVVVYRWGFIHFNNSSLTGGRRRKRAISNDRSQVSRYARRQPEGRTVLRPEEVKSLARTHVVQISCGTRHSAVVDKVGRVYTSGCNLSGQLGRGLSSKHLPSGNSSQRSRGRGSRGCSSRRRRHQNRQGETLFHWTFGVSAGVLGAARGQREGMQGTAGTDETLETRSVESVAGGDEKTRRRRECGRHTRATARGRNICCGSSADFPGCTSAGMTEKSTKGHMRVCRAEDGSVGREISGTGQGGDEFGTVEWDDSGARGKGIQVACGGFHTLVLTSTRLVWSWGGNRWGQLGLGDYASRKQPARVKALGVHHDIVSVAAGAETSAAVTSTGVLLVWGCNFRGRLGISPSTSAAPRPQVSTALSKLGVQQVALGDSFAICLTAATNPAQQHGSPPAADLPMPTSAAIARKIEEELAKSHSTGSTPRRSDDLPAPHQHLTLLRALLQIRPPEVPPVLTACPSSRFANFSMSLVNLTYDGETVTRPPVLRKNFQGAPRISATGRLHWDDGDTIQGRIISRRYQEEGGIAEKAKMGVRVDISPVRESWSRRILAEAAATLTARRQRERALPESLAVDNEGIVKPDCHSVPRQQGGTASHERKRMRTRSPEEPIARSLARGRQVGAVEQRRSPTRKRDSPTNGASQNTRRNTLPTGASQDMRRSTFCVLLPPVAGSAPASKLGVSGGRISDRAGDRRRASTPVHAWREECSISEPSLMSRDISSPPPARGEVFPAHRAAVGKPTEGDQDGAGDDIADKVEAPTCAGNSAHPGSPSEALPRDHILMFGDSCSPCWRTFAALEGTTYGVTTRGPTTGVDGSVGTSPARLLRQHERVVAMLPANSGSYVSPVGMTAVEAEATGGDALVGQESTVCTRGGDFTPTEVSISVESTTTDGAVLLEQTPTASSGGSVEETAPTDRSASVESRATDTAIPMDQQTINCTSKNGSRDGTSTEVPTSVCIATASTFVQPNAVGDGIAATNDCTSNVQQQQEGRHQQEGNRGQEESAIARKTNVCGLGGSFYQHLWTNNRELASTEAAVSRIRSTCEQRDGDGCNSRKPTNRREHIGAGESPPVPRRPSSTPSHRNAPGRQRMSIVSNVNWSGSTPRRPSFIGNLDRSGLAPTQTDNESDL